MSEEHNTRDARDNRGVVTKPINQYTCENCGLIWSGEMLNLVANKDESILGNHCPNCGSTSVFEGIHE